MEVKDDEAGREQDQCLDGRNINESPWQLNSKEDVPFQEGNRGRLTAVGACIQCMVTGPSQGNRTKVRKLNMKL